jgi:hypothetical protein
MSGLSVLFSCWADSEPNAIVRQNGMAFIRDRIDQRLQKGGPRQPVGFSFQPGEGNLRCAVDRN